MPLRNQMENVVQIVYKNYDLLRYFSADLLALMWKKW